MAQKAAQHMRQRSDEGPVLIRPLMYGVRPNRGQGQGIVLEDGDAGLGHDGAADGVGPGDPVVIQELEVAQRVREGPAVDGAEVLPDESSPGEVRL